MTKKNITSFMILKITNSVADTSCNAMGAENIKKKVITKKVSVFGMLTFFCLIYANVWAQQIINLDDENAPSKLRVAANVVPQFFKEAKTSRIFTINSALQNKNSVDAGDIVNLQLFEGKNYTAMVNNTVNDVNGNFTITLKLTDYPMAFAIITTNIEGKSLVNVSIPELNELFGCRYDVISNKIYLIEIDESKIERPNCDNDTIPFIEEIFVPEEMFMMENDTVEITELLQDALANCGPAAFDNPNAPAITTLLVVYTPAAASLATLRGGINNLPSFCLSKNFCPLAIASVRLASNIHFYIRVLSKRKVQTYKTYC